MTSLFHYRCRLQHCLLTSLSYQRQVAGPRSPSGPTALYHTAWPMECIVSSDEKERQRNYNIFQTIILFIYTCFIVEYFNLYGPIFVLYSRTIGHMFSFSFFCSISMCIIVIWRKQRNCIVSYRIGPRFKQYGIISVYIVSQCIVSYRIASVLVSNSMVSYRFILYRSVSYRIVYVSSEFE